MFGPHMAEGGDLSIQDEMAENLSVTDIEDLQFDATIMDSSLKNLEGGNASGELDTLASIWTATQGMVDGYFSTGGLISRLMGFLPKGVSTLVERAQRDASKQKALPEYLESEDDGDSSGDDDDSGLMAELLFGDHLSTPVVNKSPEDASKGSPVKGSTTNDTQIAAMVISREASIRFCPSESSSKPSGPLSTHDRNGQSSSSNKEFRDHDKADTTLVYPQAVSTIRAKPDILSDAQESEVAELVNTPEAAQLSRQEKSEWSQGSPSPATQTIKRRASNDVLREEHKEKRQRSEARVMLAQRLSLARPDLAGQKTPSRSRKSEKLRKEASSSSSSIALRHGLQTSPTLRTSHKSSESASSDCGPSINWDRTRSLEEGILEDLRKGKKPSLPVMKFVLNELFGEGEPGTRSSST